MVQLLNSIYLGAATPSDYGKAAGVVELLPFDYYLGAAVPSHGKPTVNVLLSGVSPLTLLNAVSLNYVKAFGKCEQASTPTPTSPVDIVANNGAIKVRHQSGLPLGYQPYEYITASGTQWLDTGVKLASTDIVEAEFQNSSTTGYGALYGVFAMGNSSAFYANGTYYGYDVANGKVDTGVSVDTAWHTLRLDYINGVITLDGNNTTYTPFVFDNAKNNYLFARYYNNSYGYGFKGSCKRFKVIRNGVLICDLIPVTRLSDNTIGMYDLANNVFHGNIGSGDFTISNPINDLEIYYDGTVETVQAHGKNLFDKALFNVNVESTITYTTFEIENGTYTMSTNFPLTGGATNVFVFAGEVISGASTQNNGIYNGQSQTITVTNGKYTVAYRSTTSSSSNTNNPKDYDYQLELGSTATTYEPYFEGTTATCQPLLSVGAHKDMQNVTNGAITRNVGVKVFDGTEDWEAQTAVGTYRYRLDGKLLEKSLFYSTHFVYSSATSTGLTDGEMMCGAATSNIYVCKTDMTTLDSFKAWLADQYAAGTPVIIVYPLATPTTETVTGQTLTITQGTNVVTAEGSVSDLELEVSYKGYAEVTVEEIEAVNTDENVEVIIS